MSRRAFRMALPALVFIRARKPCLRFLRRVLGWNVRFVTVVSDLSLPHTPGPWKDVVAKFAGLLDADGKYRRARFSALRLGDANTKRVIRAPPLTTSKTVCLRWPTSWSWRDIRSRTLHFPP